MSIEKLAELITEKTKKLDAHDPARMVGMQINDVVKVSGAAADVVYTDLTDGGMTLAACAEEIKKKADKIHAKQGGKCVCITPEEAAEVICEYFGISEIIKKVQTPISAPDAPPAPERKKPALSLADFFD